MKAAADAVDIKKPYKHNDPNVDWSEGCRVSHGESTHYRSAMRRTEKAKPFA